VQGDALTRHVLHERPLSFAPSGNLKKRISFILVSHFNARHVFLQVVQGNARLPKKGEVDEAFVEIKQRWWHKT